MQVVLHNCFSRCLMNVINHRIFGFLWYDSVTAEPEKSGIVVQCHMTTITTA